MTMAAFAAEPTAEEILRKADEVRNPPLDYTVSVKVTSLKPQGTPKTAAYDVLVKGKDRTVIKTLSPPVERGRVLLMRGKDMWAFLPDVSKPLRISLRERLMGEVANGDLARANFTGDYTPEILREEEADGKECYVLQLTANAEDVTYARVVLWVEKESFRPYRAEFYGLSGRLLKSCSYQEYRELGGRPRPTRLVMEDPIVKGKRSIIEYDQMNVEPLPEKYFTKDYMKKFMEG
ncbi:MAG: outer membrane lipoprotein-sorting protein [Candidatus Omnitrophica bacterium]|nr:outer membrane lipoprotein-sorting protein [Candidatus Omnitrophota bacterium]